jgi:hypothetical protein
MGLPVEVNNLMMGSLNGYTVGRSLRFRSSATAYLNRTPASAGNQQRWTWSAWVKRGTISTANRLFVAGGTSGSPTGGCSWIFQANDTFLFQSDISGTMLFTSTAVYRDPSAWYHLVCTLDTTNATANNRFIFYVNGVQVSGTYTGTITQNANLNVNSTVNHRIAQHTNDQYFDGYIAEMNFIDGQSLTPSSFGAYDTNGVWQPKKYTSTYGTNGFYLPFSNTTSTSTLVADSSGNGNNWTPTNISLTAGTTYDSMIDSPTVGPLASNYAVLNPLYSAGGGTFSNGNLQVATGTSTAGRAIATMGVSSGKWYWEITPTSIPANVVSIGVVPRPTTNDSGTVGNNASEYGYLSDGQKFSGGSAGAYGASYVANDVIGVALDLSAGTIVFYKNGTSQGTAYSSIPLTNIYIPAVSDSSSSNSGTFVANFGQRPFSYTPPTGFNALNTYNLPAPSIANGAQYMAATTYTGNGGTQTITNGGNNTIGTTFQPDFIWMKSRNNTYGHNLFDSVRGGTKRLVSNLTDAELTVSGGVNSFNTDGMTIQNDATNANINASATTYIGWQWKAGGTGVTNTSGTITSTVSSNTTAGFSIVTYTGSGALATVGHGLGVAPNMIIWKNRSAVQNWVTYHSSLGATGNVYLNLTNGYSADSTTQNNTAPTSSVFTVSTSGAVNGSTNNLVAYCFAAVSGYSAFGSYTGNGSADGSFIYTGFRPRWVLLKRTDSTSAWNLFDTSLNPYNLSTQSLVPNTSAAENTGTTLVIDILSNGFKMRNTDAALNANGGTYIYAAFAENPFRQSRAR